MYLQVIRRVTDPVGGAWSARDLHVIDQRGDHWQQYVPAQ